MIHTWKKRANYPFSERVSHRPQHRTIISVVSLPVPWCQDRAQPKGRTQRLIRRERENDICNDNAPLQPSRTCFLSTSLFMLCFPHVLFLSRFDKQSTPYMARLCLCTLPYPGLANKVTPSFPSIQWMCNQKKTHSCSWFTSLERFLKMSTS